ncbi:hypothetical protein HPT27_17580 [Permianibacter sp. IMCC34836]|uniref:hypothetical protein n=1 Tax=Permianibacter fluminis TaxID=2738515 RepID=UPI0015581E97|nr:hypothetical protein [Permianibacter fluminis]NQD38831.1 hypothetical protein [Permianibacter fluminis]
MKSTVQTSVWLILMMVSALAQAASKPAVSHPIGGGLAVSLPKSWVVKNYPMPLEGATNLRIEADDVRIAITGFPTEKGRLDKSALADMLAQSATYYLSKAKDPQLHAEYFETESALGAYAVLETASGNEEFAVFPGRYYACVAPIIISSQTMVFSISIGCEEADDDELTAALNAIRAIGGVAASNQP